MTSAPPPSVPVNVNDSKIDVLSISAHKIYGPKGIGALYVRRRPRVRLEPIISGGGQERGLRSGTVPAPLVVGFGEACRLAKREMAVRLSLPSLCSEDAVGVEREGRDETRPNLLLRGGGEKGALLSGASSPPRTGAPLRPSSRGQRHNGQSERCSTRASVSAARRASCRGSEPSPQAPAYAFAPLVSSLTLLFVSRVGIQSDHAHIRRLSERLYKGITQACEHVVRNGDVEGYPGCTNLSFAAVEGESRACPSSLSPVSLGAKRADLGRTGAVLMSIKDIAVSSGSACTSASLEPSYVLRALGAEEDMAHSSIRFGIGRFTTEEEVDFVVDKVVSSVTRLRDLSPLWEMMQEGIDVSVSRLFRDVLWMFGGHQEKRRKRLTLPFSDLLLWVSLAAQDNPVGPALVASSCVFWSSCMAPVT